jgi:hypothetical protein
VEKRALSELGAQLKTKEKELMDKDLMVREKREVLLALDPLLKEFGWSDGNLSKDKVDSSRVRASLEANREFSRAVVTGRARRAGVTVFYFPKDVDGDRVRSALSQEGFHLQQGAPRNDEPTNAVVFGRAVPHPG